MKKYKFLKKINNILRDIISKINEYISHFSPLKTNSKKYDFYLEEDFVFYLFMMYSDYFIPRICQYIINKKK